MDPFSSHAAHWGHRAILMKPRKTLCITCVMLCVSELFLTSQCWQVGKDLQLLWDKLCAYHCPTNQPDYHYMSEMERLNPPLADNSMFSVSLTIWVLDTRARRWSLQEKQTGQPSTVIGQLFFSVSASQQRISPFFKHFSIYFLLLLH